MDNTLGILSLKYVICIACLLSRTPILREFTASHAYARTAAVLATYCPKTRVKFNAIHCYSDCMCQFFTTGSELSGFKEIEHMIDARELVEQGEKHGQHKSKQD